MKAEEEKVENYECPTSVLLELEEVRIHRPWSRGVIAKRLRRKIRYKALETRLKQMWVRNV